MKSLEPISAPTLNKTKQKCFAVKTPNLPGAGGTNH
jgi:hypothetical protein